MIYMTHNGLKSLMSMRRELAEGSGDQHWYNTIFHPDDEVVVSYVSLGKDKFGNPGFAEPIG